MKVFPIHLYCLANIVLKKGLLLSFLLLSLNNLSAQIKNSKKLTIETGFPLFSESDHLSLFIYVEPKLKVSKNAYLGLRIGLSINTQKFENFDSLQFKIEDEYDNGGISLVPTFDYYFKKKEFREINYRPYAGMGLGLYLLNNYVDVTRTIATSTSENEFEVYVKNQIGFLIRTGLESEKLRMGLEYNLISIADIELPNNQAIGTVDNSYIGLSIAYVFGG